MKKSLRRLIAERAVRITADSLMLSLSMAIAFLVRGLVFNNITLYELTEQWTKTTGLAILISIPIFWFSGFYTSGRYYQSKYKAITVFQGVSFSFLILASIVYFTKGIIDIPRSVILVGWALSSFILICARLWSVLWRMFMEFDMNSKRVPSQISKINKILIIGGGGYVGSGLLEHTLKKGYKVRLLDILMFGDVPIKKYINHPNLEVIKADFREVDKVTEAMRGVDAVIHLGGLVGDPACSLDEKLTTDINLTATRTIAEIAKGYGVQRFIFASSCSVYGASDDLLEEVSKLNPVSLYAKTKIASEQVLLKLAGNDFCPIILRFGTIYGLSGRTRFDLVVNLLTAKAIKEGKITVYGGDQWRPFVHVNDAAKAVFMALEADLELVRNEIFNVGSDEQNKTLGQVGEIIKELVPEAELLDMGVDGDRRNYKVSFKKICTKLGFKPDWDLESGILQVIDALDSGKVKDYKNPIYSNVQFLRDPENFEILKYDEKEEDLKLLEVFV
jgi:nucleoside-diphosphate-sugar epimerase